MYPREPRIRALLAEVDAGRESRPLLLCEYAHSMGNSTGGQGDVAGVDGALSECPHCSNSQKIVCCLRQLEGVLGPAGEPPCILWGLHMGLGRPVLSSKVHKAKCWQQQQTLWCSQRGS